MSRPHTPRGELVIRVLALAAVYFLVGALMLTLAGAHPTATTLWPTPGIALAALLLCGRALWPGILIGAVLLNLLAFGSIESAIGIAVGSTLGSLVGADLMFRFARGPQAFDRPLGVLTFSVLGSLLSAAISATFAVGSLTVLGHAAWSFDRTVWVNWWLTDAVGAQTFAPIFVLWALNPRIQWTPRLWGEGTLLLGLWLLTSQVILSFLSPLLETRLPPRFLSMPVIVWIAFRYRQREMVTALGILFSLAIWGPLRGSEVEMTDLALRLQMLVGSVMCMALTAAFSEKREANEATQDAEERIQLILERQQALEALDQSQRRFVRMIETAGEGILEYDQHLIATYANPRFLEMMGYTSEDVIGKSVYDLLGEANLEAVHQWMNQSGRRGSERYDLPIRTRDGSYVWTMVSTSPAVDHQGLVVGGLAMFTDISDRKRVEEALRHQALYDTLTGLPNRALFGDRLQQALLLGEQHQALTMLLLVDLDRFKEVNDTFGHAAGDALLCDIAQRLLGAVHERDTVARLGGDEFAVIMSMARDQAEGEELASRMLTALGPPFSLEGVSFAVHASIGLAIAPTHSSNASDLMRHADVAMYRAKRMGGGSFALFDPADAADSLDLLQLRTELEEAIAEERLLLYYQPVMDLQDRRIVWVEALARWPDPRRGLVQPGLFVPLAEDTGLIRRMTLHLLVLAVDQLRKWQEEDVPISVGVNLSGHDLRDPQLVDTVLNELKHSGVPPSRLKVEITESALVDDPQRALDMIQHFRANGIQVAIDDFGSGYSSLAYLRHLPADLLKIDMEFVRQITTVPQDLAIVRAIIDLGHHLGLRVLAEGVENRETLELLAAQGCDYVQGFYIGRPMPADELVARLRADGFLGA